MKFRLKPVLSQMKELYEQPISQNRFKAYLAKLEGGSKGAFSIPIAGFNPMAKDHVQKKIIELEELEAEKIVQQVCNLFNSKKYFLQDKKEIWVTINLADDLGGAWTNRFTTDYLSKFKIKGLISRNFCVPYFWTSEEFTKEKIQVRTEEYLNRTLFNLLNAEVVSLEDHLKQEIHVSKNSLNRPIIKEGFSFEELEKHFRIHRKSNDYNLIFNFFYGDEASETLGYKKYRLGKANGFNYAKYLASN